MSLPLQLLAASWPWLCQLDPPHILSIRHVADQGPLSDAGASSSRSSMGESDVAEMADLEHIDPEPVVLAQDVDDELAGLAELVAPPNAEVLEG